MERWRQKESINHNNFISWVGHQIKYLENQINQKKTPKK